MINLAASFHQPEGCVNYVGGGGGGGANLLVDVTKLKRGGTAKSRFSAQGSKLGRVLSSRRNLGFQ